MVSRRQRAGETGNLIGRVDPGKMMMMFDRGDYWQCAFVIPKGQMRLCRRGDWQRCGTCCADGADPEDPGSPK